MFFGISEGTVVLGDDKNNESYSDLYDFPQ
jgi:hypothetical protein